MLFEERTLTYCPILISVAVIKHPGKSNLRMKGFILAHYVWLQSIIVGNSRQELETASHFVYTFKNTEGGTHTWCLLVHRLSSLFKQFKTLCLGNGVANSGMGLPISVNLRYSRTDLPISKIPKTRFSDLSRLNQVKSWQPYNLIRNPDNIL